MYLNRLSLNVLLYLVGLFLTTKFPLEKKKLCLQSYPPDLCILYSAAVAV